MDIIVYIDYQEKTTNKEKKYDPIESYQEKTLELLILDNKTKNPANKNYGKVCAIVFDQVNWVLSKDKLRLYPGVGSCEYKDDVCSINTLYDSLYNIFINIKKKYSYIS